MLLLWSVIFAGGSGGPPPTFNPAWASRANLILGTEPQQ